MLNFMHENCLKPFAIIYKFVVTFMTQKMFYLKPRAYTCHRVANNSFVLLEKKNVKTSLDNIFYLTLKKVNKFKEILFKPFWHQWWVNFKLSSNFEQLFKVILRYIIVLFKKCIAYGKIFYSKISFLVVLVISFFLFFF